MNPDLYGLVEMILSFGIVLGFCFWQLHSVNKARRKTQEERRKAAENPPPQA